jgi:rubredoxin
VSAPLAPPPPRQPIQSSNHLSVQKGMGTAAIVGAVGGAIALIAALIGWWCCRDIVARWCCCCCCCFVAAVAKRSSDECGHVYDKYKDWSSGKVIFEALPPDWTCPECGGKKEGYEEDKNGAQICRNKRGHRSRVPAPAPDFTPAEVLAAAAAEEAEAPAETSILSSAPRGMSAVPVACFKDEEDQMRILRNDDGTVKIADSAAPASMRSSASDQSNASNQKPVPSQATLNVLKDQIGSLFTPRPDPAPAPSAEQAPQVAGRPAPALARKDTGDAFPVDVERVIAEELMQAPPSARKRSTDRPRGKESAGAPASPRSQNRHVREARILLSADEEAAVGEHIQQLFNPRRAAAVAPAPEPPEQSPSAHMYVCRARVPAERSPYLQTRVPAERSPSSPQLPLGQPQQPQQEQTLMLPPPQQPPQPQPQVQQKAQQSPAAAAAAAAAQHLDVVRQQQLSSPRSAATASAPRVEEHSAPLFVPAQYMQVAEPAPALARKDTGAARMASAESRVDRMARLGILVAAPSTSGLAIAQLPLPRKALPRKAALVHPEGAPAPAQQSPAAAAAAQHLDVVRQRQLSSPRSAATASAPRVEAFPVAEDNHIASAGAERMVGGVRIGSKPPTQMKTAEEECMVGGVRIGSKPPAQMKTAVEATDFTKEAAYVPCMSLFDKYDVDKSGTISLAECVLAMESMGPLASQFVKSFKAADANGDGVLNRAEFYAMYKESVAVLPHGPGVHSMPLAWLSLTEEERGELICKYAFRKYDTMGKNQEIHLGVAHSDFNEELDVDGQIEMVEALRVMKVLLGPLARNFPRHFVHCDYDENGYLNFEEFHALYRRVLKEAGKTPDQMVATKAQMQLRSEVASVTA